MNFLIIGHSVVDKIVNRGLSSIKPGGVFYSVISLLSQVEPEDKIFLCSNISNECARLFNDAYNRVENDYLTNVSVIPQVELVISEENERTECYSKLSDNLTLPEKELNRFDGILINMITGYDLSLSQLLELRKNYKGLIYFDVHTLSRGVDKNLKRDFRKIENFNKWANCIDILQANESELKTLSEKSEETEIVNALISYGIKQVVITRSHKGASVYVKNGDSLNHYNKEALKLQVINKVGCGDVFGSIYFYNYIKSKDILLALEQANIYAGISTTYSDTRNFLNLRKDAIKRSS